jgi:hypothetical protein
MGCLLVPPLLMVAAMTKAKEPILLIELFQWGKEHVSFWFSCSSADTSLSPFILQMRSGLSVPWTLNQVCCGYQSQSCFSHKNQQVSGYLVSRIVQN